MAGLILIYGTRPWTAGVLIGQRQELAAVGDLANPRRSPSAIAMTRADQNRTRVSLSGLRVT
jgi:hypothetical protein